MDRPASFIWYELMTTDASAAARFYGAVVGWKIAGSADPAAAGGQDYRMIQRSDGGSAGGVLQLTPQMCEQGAKTTWLGYLHVKDVDAALRAINGDGGSTLMPKRSLPVGEIAMVSDPAGAPFYVMHPIPPPDKPDAVSDVFDTAASQRVRWNELASSNLGAAKAFYSRHFGFEFNETMPMGAAGDYCFIDQGGRRIGGMMQKSAADAVAGWLFYFGVSSASAAKREIEGGGGKVLVDLHQVPSGDWILVGEDPQGAPFGVVGAQ
jgi:predicted enzyme related to lactoylglutathione lyase